MDPKHQKQVLSWVGGQRFRESVILEKASKALMVTKSLGPWFPLSVHSWIPGFNYRCTPRSPVSPVSKIGALLGPRFQRSVHSWVPGFKDRCTPGSPVSKIGALLDPRFQRSVHPRVSGRSFRCTLGCLAEVFGGLVGNKTPQNDCPEVVPHVL